MANEEVQLICPGCKSKLSGKDCIKTQQAPSKLIIEFRCPYCDYEETLKEVDWYIDFECPKCGSVIGLARVPQLIFRGKE